MAERSELGRRLAALRGHHRIMCPVCGTETCGFAKQRYCSKRCANKASYRRVKERRARVQKQEDSR